MEEQQQELPFVFAVGGGQGDAHRGQGGMGAQPGHFAVEAVGVVPRQGAQGHGGGAGACVSGVQGVVHVLEEGLGAGVVGR